MSELYKIVLTSALTILGGIIIYISGQIISNFFIDPINEQRKIIGEIDDSLIFFAHLYCNPSALKDEKYDAASIKFRQLSTLLVAKTRLIPKYAFFEKLNWVIKQKNIYSAHHELVGLSNSFYKNIALNMVGSANYDTASKIAKLLYLERETLQ